MGAGRYSCQLACTQKFSEKGKALPTLIEKESFGCFYGWSTCCAINGTMVALQGTHYWTYRLSESQLIHNATKLATFHITAVRTPLCMKARRPADSEKCRRFCCDMY
jgi:hypothetical protein